MKEGQRRGVGLVFDRKSLPNPNERIDLLQDELRLAKETIVSIKRFILMIESINIIEKSMSFM